MSKGASHLLGRKAGVRLAGFHNVMGAVLASEAGFDGLWASGFEFSASLGLADSNFVTPNQVASMCALVSRRVKLPILVDFDTGYGGAEQARYFAELFQSVGCKGLCIEDKTFPKNNSYSDKPNSLEEVEDCQKKISAIKQHCGREFVVVARTEALVLGRGVELALNRASAFVDAGADAVLVHSKSNVPDEVQAFCNDWGGTLQYSRSQRLIPALHMTVCGKSACMAVFMRIKDSGLHTPRWLLC
ncbi:MAG: isocitrate lyase/phosphoenolpyruvate mutase family protein [Caulobacteraceae bacterium]|nr:isocitrate lyase/phosphoenolpyruvate mutase family protein [Caulobacteraceae bacterium]